MLVRRDADDLREIRPRTGLGALIVVCAMLVLVVRLYQLQILRGEVYIIQSIANFRKTLFVPADRGVIKDGKGRTLVDNRPSFDVFLTPAFCKGKERDEVLDKLAAYLRLGPEDIERIKSDYQKSWFNKDKLERFKPFLVLLDIPRDQVDVLEAHKTEMSCVNLIPTPHRAYHAPASFGHVLGYMSEVTPEELDDNPEYRRGQTIGRRGLERRWERELRGADGKQNIAVDAKGRELDQDTQQALIPENERLVPATPGNNLILSVDEKLQRAADVAFTGRAGAVVVMEAKTGFILMARRFGYGQPTGLDLGREIPGYLPDTKTITPESGSARAHAINASIGQGEINVTPLQQAVAYAAVANGGNILRPQAVRRIESPDGKVLREFQPEVLRKVELKEGTLELIREGLFAVVNEPGGTGWRSRLQDPQFAGKTGTAQVMKLGQKQKLDPTTQAYLSRDHAWFAAFAPASDPEIVVVVLNEHGGWGAEAAAPAASKVIAAYFKMKREEAVPAPAAVVANPAPTPSVATSSVGQ